MKNIILSALTLLFLSNFSQTATAQGASKDEASVLKMWDTVWKAYEAGDEAKMWSFDSQTPIVPMPEAGK